MFIRRHRHAPLERIYREYFPLLCEKCRRMLVDPEEAADVAQETFIRFWEAEPGGFEPVQATAWLYRTSTRLAIDRLRRRAPRRAFLEAAAKEDPVTEEGTVRVELRALLRKIARDVPRRELELAVLHRVDGLEQGELRALTKLSERTIRRLLTRFDARIGALRDEEC